MLFGLLLGVFGFIHTREDGKAITDDVPFRLHYVFTSGLLFLCTALVGLQEVVGKNIDCFNNDATHKAINQYCWVTGTQFLTDTEDSRALGQFAFDDGVKCSRQGNKWLSDEGKECQPIQSYYQWVPYVFFIQAIMFYIPRKFWFKMEEGKIEAISDGVRAGTVVKSDDSDDKLKNVARNVANYIKLEQAGHLKYGFCFLLSQFWNCCNLLFSFMMINALLDGRFTTLGYKWLSAVLNPNVDSSMVLYRIFPRMTSCSFDTYGTGGGLTQKHYSCLLAPNIISEKIFTFLWFWYVILGLVTVINLLLFLSMAIKSHNVRKIYIARLAWTKKVNKDACQTEYFNRKIGELNFGQFLFIYLLGRNVNYTVYKRILMALVTSNDQDSPCGNVLDGERDPVLPGAPFEIATMRVQNQCSYSSTPMRILSHEPSDDEFGTESTHMDFNRSARNQEDDFNEGKIKEKSF